MTLEERVLDICRRHGPRTKEEILQSCGCDPAEEQQCGEVIEKLAYEGVLFRAYEDRWQGKGKQEILADKSLAFLTREWYEKCRGNPAYTF
jgi:hypothetical protein